MLEDIRTGSYQIQFDEAKTTAGAALLAATLHIELAAKIDRSAELDEVDPADRARLRGRADAELDRAARAIERATEAKMTMHRYMPEDDVVAQSHYEHAIGRIAVVREMHDRAYDYR